MCRSFLLFFLICPVSSEEVLREEGLRKVGVPSMQDTMGLVRPPFSKSCAEIFLTGVLLPPLLVDLEPVERDLDEEDGIKMERKGTEHNGSDIQIEKPVQVLNCDETTHCIGWVMMCLCLLDIRSLQCLYSGISVFLVVLMGVAIVMTIVKMLL